MKVLKESIKLMTDGQRHQTNKSKLRSFGIDAIINGKLVHMTYKRTLDITEIDPWYEFDSMDEAIDFLKVLQVEDFEISPDEQNSLDYFYDAFRKPSKIPINRNDVETEQQETED